MDLNEMLRRINSYNQPPVPRTRKGPTVPAAYADNAPLRAAVREVPKATSKQAKAIQAAFKAEDKAMGAPLLAEAPAKPVAAAPRQFPCWVCLNVDCAAKFRLFKSADTPALCGTCGMQAGHALITFPPTVTATFTLTPSAEALAALAQAKADEERMKAASNAPRPAPTPRTAGQDVPSRPLTPAEEAGEADDLIEAVEAHMDQLIAARVKFTDEDLDDEPRLFEAAVIWLSRYKGDDPFLSSVRRGGLSSMSQPQARGVLNTWKRERAAARRQNGGK